MTPDLPDAFHDVGFDTPTIEAERKPMICIAIVNQSTDARVTTEVLTDIMNALALANADYVAAYGSGVQCCFRLASMADVGATEWPLRVVDTTGIPDALAYHDEEGNRPALVAEALSEADAEGSTLTFGAESLSVAMGHEVNEALKNAFVNQWIDLPNASGDQIPEETVDPVQGYFYGAGPKQISVPDFVDESWFNPNASVKPFDFLGKLTRPFQVAPGGYMSVRHEDGSIETVFGERVTEAKKARVARSGRVARSLRSGSGIV